MVRTLLAMMLTTAEGTTQVSSPGIAGVCEKSNAAVHAMSDTTLESQTGIRPENRIQRVLILPDKRINTLVQMPILAKRKEFTDGDDKKARDSVTISNRITTHLVLLHRRESIERQHEVFSCARPKTRNRPGAIPSTRIRLTLHASCRAHPDPRTTTWNNESFFFEEILLSINSC